MRTDRNKRTLQIPQKAKAKTESKQQTNKKHTPEKYVIAEVVNFCQFK